MKSLLFLVCMIVIGAGCKQTCPDGSVRTYMGTPLDCPPSLDTGTSDGTDTDGETVICIEEDTDGEYCNDRCNGRCFEESGSWPSGYTYGPYGSYGCQANPAEYPFQFFTDTFPPSTHSFADFRRGIDEWQAISSRLHLDIVDETGETPLGDPEDEEQDVLMVGEYHRDFGVLGITLCELKDYTVGDELACGHDYCDVIIFELVAWPDGSQEVNYTSGAADVETSKTSLARVLEHEIGHTLGLPDLERALFPDSIMVGDDEHLYVDFAAPNSADKAAITYIYGK